MQMRFAIDKLIIIFIFKIFNIIKLKKLKFKKLYKIGEERPFNILNFIFCEPNPSTPMKFFDLFNFKIHTNYVEMKICLFIKKLK